MEELNILNKSRILIGESFSNYKQYFSSTKLVIITDTNLHTLYSDFFGNHTVIVIPPGENHKTLKTVEYIYAELIRLDADRTTFLLGFGGGVICDITGFVATTFMRGLQFGFISTTLLSQIDASIGGKNGVNFKRFKNMIGTFQQANFVICDPKLLLSLPDYEYKNGFSELIKYALIADAEMFQWIENQKSSLINKDLKWIEEMTLRSIKIKSKFVNEDIQDLGSRRILNFGHTLAHAIEKNSSLSHGEAVSIGLLFATKWSVDRCNFPKQDLQRLESLLQSLELTTSIKINISKLMSAIKGDKKRNNDTLDFIFLSKIGNAEIQKVSFHELEKALLCYV